MHGISNCAGILSPRFPGSGKTTRHFGIHYLLVFDIFSFNHLSDIRQGLCSKTYPAGTAAPSARLRLTESRRVHISGKRTADFPIRPVNPSPRNDETYRTGAK
jgi:hypothetical protein